MMKKALSLFVVTLVLAANLAFTLPCEAAAPKIPPKPTTDIFVQDYSGVLSDATKQHILQTSEALSKATGAQAAVLTVKTIGDTPVEDYALAVLRGWGIGDKTKNNGVLLLVVTGDHKLRIEVGYGLEGAIPDAKAGRIMDELIIPSFKTGDLDTGIKAGYDAIAANIAAETGYTINGVTDQTTPDKTTDYQNTTPQTNWFSRLPAWERNALLVLVLLLAVGFFVIDNIFLGGFFTSMLILLLSMLARGGRGGGSGGGGGGGSSFGGGSGGGGGASRDW